MVVCFFLLFSALTAIHPTAPPSCFATEKPARDTLSFPSVPPAFSYGNVRDYIFHHLHYPQTAIDSNIQGTVMLHFTITPEGRVDSLRITQPLHPLLDEEALRLFREMPQWKPVVHRGKPISLSYEIPVIFELTEKNAPGSSGCNKKQ